MNTPKTDALMCDKNRDGNDLPALCRQMEEGLRLAASSRARKIMNNTIQTPPPDSLGSPSGSAGRVLRLTLKRRWFDMIASGQKKEEYREIKDWIISRLHGKTYDVVEFSNGYGAHVPKLTVEYLGWRTGTGRAAWGATPGKPTIIIRLGAVLSRQNDLCYCKAQVCNVEVPDDGNSRAALFVCPDCGGKLYEDYADDGDPWYECEECDFSCDSDYDRETGEMFPDLKPHKNGK